MTRSEEYGRDFDGTPICQVCGDTYSCDDEREVDGFCHDCAHDVAAHAMKPQLAAARRRQRARHRVKKLTPKDQRTTERE